MNFDKLLEYQTIDIDLFKIERELNNSAEKERAAKYNTMMKTASENMSKLNAEADELMANIEKVITNIAASEIGVDEIAKHISDIDDLNEAEFYEKKLATLSEEMDRLVKELFRLNSRIEYVKDNSEKLTKQALQINEKYKNAYNAYTDLRKKFAAEGKPINDKLKALEKDIDIKYIEIYKRCRSNKKLPAFVAYKGDGSCYCGMNLPNDCINKLKKVGDMVECPNCGRVILMK